MCIEARRIDPMCSLKQLFLNSLKKDLIMIQRHQLQNIGDFDFFSFKGSSSECLLNMNEYF